VLENSWGRNRREAVCHGKREGQRAGVAAQGDNTGWRCGGVDLCPWGAVDSGKREIRTKLQIHHDGKQYSGTAEFGAGENVSGLGKETYFRWTKSVFATVVATGVKIHVLLAN
jgi:hypothetical protein